ncbi:hypothetical protein [Gemmatimonas sp.]|jgi:hypothetical protein|uniref:hypothetical protein n=1 Tax=Gemmatimonas sp. TaxID=1962908 RepID=UPI0027BA2916|nr:hypothetical protein [Gemmatimonas sp.]
MRTTVDIDDTLLGRLRDAAHRQGLPFRTLLHRVLQRGLEAGDEPDAVTYRTPSVPLGQVREGVNLVKALELSAALEDDERARHLLEGR